MISALCSSESLPSMPYTAARHDGEGVVVDSGGVAGHVEAADDLPVQAVDGRGGAGPAVVRAAVVLRADHLVWACHSRARRLWR